MTSQVSVKRVSSYRSPEARRLVRAISYALLIPVWDLTLFRRPNPWVGGTNAGSQIRARSPRMRYCGLWTGSFSRTDHRPT